MNEMKPFDIIDAPLSGANLIEASAGTGKTYTITGLYLRLIVEKHLSVDQILLVTFTKAATEELKQRIRSKLIEARKAFQTGRSDDLMLDRIVRNTGDGKTALERIKDAIRDFDVCAIFTIHGFCQRVLHENAFETGSLFDTELVTNQQRMLRSVCQDFWRQMLYDAAPEFIGYTLSRLEGPDKLLSLFNQSKDPGLRVIPQVDKPVLNGLEPFRACGQRLAEIFPQSKIDVQRRLMDPGLYANSYGSLKPGKGQTGRSPREVKVNGWLDSVEAFCNHPPLRFPLFKDFDKLSAATIRQKTKKGHEPVRHLFFEQCETLGVANQNLLFEMDELLLFHKTEFFRFAQKQLARLKKEQNVQYFDDLLVRLKDALEKENQNLLAASVRSRFRAALVDEFQDTDMTQYSIFSRLFSGKNNLLFMIGDPKQAIYGFRGADIFSYLKASSDTKRRYTLQTNYRSSVGLITAVNTIFSQVQNPFVFDAIPFTHSKAADNARNRNETSSGSFQLWFTDSGEEKPQNKTDAVERISRAMTGEIRRLIRDPETVKPGDIAVLVRTNLQADIVKQHLFERNIPAVVYSAGNVFETREARDLFLLLLGISDPFNPGRFRAALATSLMGVTGDVLDLEGDTDTEQALQLKHFLDYRRIWQKDGFMRMFNRFMAQEKVRVRLLGMAAGERRLTNVLHLAELLHTDAAQKKLSVEGLLNWFSIQRDPESETPETHQLRLESDALAVKIITIHKSKGLQFPVVFCPFAWGSSRVTGSDFTFHDPEAEQRLTLDLGSEALEDHRQQAQFERLAENLRLLYVALTRAQKRCYLAWGRINDVDTSAMAYLLHYQRQGESSPDAALVGKIRDQYRTKTGDMLLKDLEKLAASSGNSIVVSKLPEDIALNAAPAPISEETFSRRHFSAPIDRSWRISSYSSLISNRTPDNELPDRDEQTAVPEKGRIFREPAIMPADSRDRSIFAFPKGPAAGIFFHDIFEHLDFAATDENELNAIVSQKLSQYGFDPLWRDTVSGMIKQVLDTGLASRSDIVQLSSLTQENRINEMEFYFPLKNITPNSLRTVFERHHGTAASAHFSEHLGRLQFAPARGFMKGYIDLVFRHNERYYLIDWKSNHLGASIEDYGPKQLAASMEHAYYVLQYHIYTLALHLYLMHRLPGYQYEKDFGGVFYLFIRGVDSAVGSDSGIFFDRPDGALVDALAEELIPGYPIQ